MNEYWLFIALVIAYKEFSSFFFFTLQACLSLQGVKDRDEISDFRSFVWHKYDYSSFWLFG